MDSRSLKQYNTFKVDAHCSKLISVYSEIDVFKAMVDHDKPFRIISGGSNILLTQDIEATVLLNEIKGITVVDEDEDTAIVSVGAGEYWHQFILWCLSHNIGGLENLALIPGKVGAAPIQNIGAYGVEQETCFHSLKAVNLEEGTTKVFYKDDCQFGYRDSIFKGALKGKYFITQVNYLLHKKHSINTSYGAVSSILEEKNIENPTITDVANAIIDIRQSKLPNPAEFPNVGSFFKNPIVSTEVMNVLKKEYPEVKYYEVDEQNVKIPAAWLIDQAGFKGMIDGRVGTHKNHALVIVNYDNATGQEIFNFSEKILETVQTKFGITLEREVNVW